MAHDQQTAPVITTTPAFAVHRRERLLVGPAGPTPRETKRLSDIDDQETHRRSNSSNHKNSNKMGWGDQLYFGKTSVTKGRS